MILGILLSGPLPARSTAPLELPRVRGPVELDGPSEESAWQGIEPLPLTMYQPVYRGTSGERTEIRVAYDDRYLYASGRFYDSDPSGVRAHSLYRDRDRNDDSFTLVIDSFNDKENALLFSTNPEGVRVDAGLSQDGRSMNASWDTFWTAAAVRTGEGWFAEIRIPLSSLGFSRRAERVVIGLIAVRAVSRKNERLVFPDISPKWPIFTPSLSREVILSDVASEKPVYVTPYVIGGAGENAVWDAAVVGFGRETSRQWDAGLDVKYNVTPYLTIDASLNTDFAQVEADDQRINLTRFSLFFPEKRRFFQERSGIFAFSTAARSANRVFHSRTIGLNEGREVPILGGLRMVGRMGGWDVGLINMLTDRSGERPRENFGVLRLRRQVFNPWSHAGGILTGRLDFKGRSNLVLGLDGIFRLFGDEYLTLKWAQAFDSGLPNDGTGGWLDRASLFALWQRRSLQGLNYTLSAARSGRDFVPELGFIQRRDFTELSWRVSYDRIMGEETPFRQISPIQCFGYVFLCNRDGAVESAQFEYDTDLHWKSGASVWLDGEIYHEALPALLHFPENTEIPAGKYTFAKLEGGYNMGTHHRLRGFFRAGYGSFYDGTRGEWGITGLWNISPHLGLFLDYGADVVRFGARGQGFDAHILRLRVESALDSRLSLNGFIQFNSVGDFLTGNLRFRCNFAEGRDLWIVYNQGLNLDRRQGDLFLPRVNDRTLLVKYTTTLCF